jgi:transposase
MARKDYTQEFRRQAVDLYRSTPGATLRGVAADLGISRHMLQVWVHALDPNLTSPASEPLSEAAVRLSGARTRPCRLTSGFRPRPRTR